MLLRTPVLVALAFVGTALSGCVNLPGATDPASALPAGLTEYDTSRAWSMPLSPALYDLLEPVKQLVPSFDETKIGMGLFFPNVPGCDWNATEVPTECKLPVVMDAGPYYEDHVDRDKFRPPLVEWLVPRGYVVVQMSIRGTGESEGCMELFSENEQKDVDAMVTWAATQPWSNGNVGMMGRSYDGTTPWMAAAQGNPHLKTIVPISSVPALSEMMFKNGTSEFRGPIFHNVVYWSSYGVGVDALGGGVREYRVPYAASQACQAVVDGTTVPARTAATGEADDPYWAERDLAQKALANWRGSVWIVHGLEDWNVNPSQVVPFYQQVQDAGLDAKMWLGVWGHAYPDRSDEHRNVRWDWADQTVKWFDYYLKGVGEKPRLDVEVEDSLFVWRSEETYPPRDASFREFALGGDGSLGEGAPAGRFTLVGGATNPLGMGVGFGGMGPTGGRVTFESEPLDAALRVAGLPQLHVTVTPTTPAGSHIFAELYDVYPDGRTVRIGWGAINTRFANGGNDEPVQLVPGTSVIAPMEFEPVDAHLGAGHRLRLVVHREGVEDVLPSPTASPEILELGDGVSVLRLPIVDRPSILPTYVPPGLSG